MKQYNWLFFICLLLLFSFESCENDDPEIGDSVLPKCTNLGNHLIEYQEIKNERASIEIRVSKYNGVNDTIYLINYPKNVYKYFDGCNLPNKFRKDSLQIEFSGKVYIPKDHEKISIGSLPIQLSNIQINTSK